MEDFSKLFYEEAFDLLSTLEESLLLLEEDTTNKELINEVFRIMHSLKGSGAMFGFTNLSSFTHELESLYDLIRIGKLQLNSDIISFTMSSVDHIKNLLNDDSSSDFVAETEEKKKIIGKLLLNQDPEQEVSNNKISEKSISSPKKEIINNYIYYIKFEPDEDILNDGTNPLYLIDELIDLGDSIVLLVSNELPDFDKINTEKCYLGWVIILSTTVSKDDINDVFIFVEDESKIIIELLSEKDLFSISNAKSTFEYLLNNKPNDVDSFKNMALSLEDELDRDKNISVIEVLEDDKENIKDTVIDIKTTTTVDTDNITENSTKPIKKAVSNPESFNIDTVKVSSAKLDTLINLVSELVTTQARLITIANDTKSTELAGLAEDYQHLSRQFRDIAFDMRLIPIQTMLIKFKRLIRDLSKSLNKKVEFITEGTETELDKNIIATISDPIMHIIRNSIDHGIETKDIRLKNNKPATGTIFFKSEYSGTSILITIADDGAGIDKKKVLSKAIDKKLVLPTDKLTDEEIYKLLLLPGFSTSETVTNISGRGVGMDVVTTKINELRGELSISSKQGKGTTIIIKLPLTLSIIDGLLISINFNKFVIPLSSVKKIYKVSRFEIDNAYHNVIKIEGNQYPFIDLTKEFDNNGETEENLHFISVAYHNKIAGIIINDLVSEYQAVLKPIDKLLKNNEIFAGASILGDGKVALVLDTNKIIDYYSIQNIE